MDLFIEELHKTIKDMKTQTTRQEETIQEKKITTELPEKTSLKRRHQEYDDQSESHESSHND